MNAQQTQIYNAMVEKAKALSVAELGVAIRETFINHHIPSEVQSALLDAMESKLSEKDFIVFVRVSGNLHTVTHGPAGKVYLFSCQGFLSCIISSLSN